MMRAALLIAFGVTALFSPGAAGQTRVHRDWGKYPAVVQMTTDQDLFAVSDPHGDYDRLVALLAGAHVIAGVPAKPENVSWAAGKSVVVFVGDLIDKGNRSLAVIALARSLQSSAARSGGKVIILSGNHEAEFLAAPNEEKVAEFAGELRGAGLQPADVAACNGDLGQFLCSLPFALQVNDWFFCHGGNTGGRTLKKLMADIQSGVDRDGYASSELIGDDSLLEARLGDNPWFDRKGGDEKTTLAAYVSALGVAHIVQGHQPGHVSFSDGTKRKSGEVFQRFGLLFLIDTGMSFAVDDSQGGLLRISRGGKQDATAMCFDGTATKIWDAHTPADQGHAKRCGE